MGKFEEQKMKIWPIIRNWFDQLIKQCVTGKKPKKIREKLEDKIINDIWKLFDTEKEEIKEEAKQKTH